MRFCEECGAKLEDDAKFCEECGTPVEIIEEQVVEAPVEIQEPVASQASAEVQEPVAPKASAEVREPATPQVSVNQQKPVNQQEPVASHPVLGNKKLVIILAAVIGVLLIAIIVGLILFFTNGKKNKNNDDLSSGNVVYDSSKDEMVSESDNQTVKDDAVQDENIGETQALTNESKNDDDKMSDEEDKKDNKTDNKDKKDKDKKDKDKDKKDKDKKDESKDDTDIGGTGPNINDWGDDKFTLVFAEGLEDPNVWYSVSPYYNYETGECTSTFIWDEGEEYSPELNQYWVPFPDKVIYTEEAFEVFTKDVLRVMRNEIFARHGRIFDSEDLNMWFSCMPWYEPRYTASEFDASVLNEIELRNIDTIKAVEDRK